MNTQDIFPINNGQQNINIMTKEEIINYVVKRYFAAPKKRAYIFSEAERKKFNQNQGRWSNLNSKDLDVIDMINGYDFSEVRKMIAEYDNKVRKIMNERSKKARMSNKIRDEKRELKGKEFKKQMEPGDVVKVQMSGSYNGTMYVIEMNENNFMGRYVYQKMDATGSKQWKKRPVVTEKMYKFVLEIVCKQATLIS